MQVLGIVAFVGYYGVAAPGSHAQIQIGGEFWFYASLFLVKTNYAVGLPSPVNQKFRPLLRLLFAAPSLAFVILLFVVFSGVLLQYGVTLRALSQWSTFLEFFYPQAIGLVVLAYAINLLAWLIGNRWPQVEKRWMAGFFHRETTAPLSNRSRWLLKAPAICCVTFLVGLLTTLGVLHAFFKVENHPQPWCQPDLKEVADKENAATFYKEAAQLLVDQSEKIPFYSFPYRAINAFWGDEASDRAGNFKTTFPPEKPAKLLAPFETLLPELQKQLHQASACSDCVWKTDYANGLRFPRLTEQTEKRNAMDDVIEIGQLQVVRLIEQKRFDEAITCWIDVMTLIRFQSRETLLGYLINKTLEAEQQGLQIADSMANELTPRQRARLLHAIDSLPPRTRLEELVPFHEEACLRWAKNNPIALIDYLDPDLLAQSWDPSLLEQIEVGRRHGNIDWQQVESIMADEAKIDALATCIEELYDNRYDRSDPKLDGIRFNEEVAAALSGRGLQKLLSPQEQATDDALRKLRAHFKALDAGKLTIDAPK